MRMLRSIAVLVFVSNVLACSEEEPTARKSLGGVEGQTPLKELDDSQRDAVCDAADDKLEAAFSDDDLARGRCLLTAYVSSHAQAMAMEDSDEAELCEDALEGCVEMPVNPNDACPGDVASSCTASVNDLDRCLSLAESLYRELSDRDCEDVSDLDDLDDRIQASANACDVLVGCFAQELPDSGTPDASDPILDASESDASDPLLDASESDASDDDAG